MLCLSSLAHPPSNTKYFLFFLATISVLAASLLIPLICGNIDRSAHEPVVQMFAAEVFVNLQLKKWVEREK